MQATTTTKLANVIKDVWTEPQLRGQMNRIYGMEIEDAVSDLRRNVNRQLYQNPRYGGYTVSGPAGNVMHVPVVFTTNPAEHKARVEEMSQRYAALQRKGKPSYRQRQKNAKAARRGNR